MRRSAKILLLTSLTVVSLGFLGLVLHGTLLQAPSSGTWAPAPGALAEARSNAAAAALADGSVLVTGGDGAAGSAVASAELFGADGAFSSVAPMAFPRSQHVAVALKDGRVLVAGGNGVDGNASNSAEIFDPASGAWQAAGAMLEPRAGATATRLSDGKVLIAGGANGDAASMTLELFDPSSDSFVPAGVMSGARKDHAAALLAGDPTIPTADRVLLAGGSDGTNALASTEVWDAASGAVVSGPALSIARSGLSATTLLDGSVLIAGGAGASGELGLTEVYSPASGLLELASSQLASPRQKHLAIFLPHNSAVLFAGGTAGGTAVPAVELYVPWAGGFASTGQPSAPRSDAAASAASEGLLVVAGGKDSAGALLNSAEVYGFATVKTDKDDYAPGEIVTITGGGWESGDDVILTLHETNNLEPHPDRVWIVTADANGNLFDNSFYPEAHDVGIRFMLTAEGARSQAQATFLDNTPIIQGVSPNPFSPNQASSAGVKDTTTISARNQSSGSVSDFRIRIHSGTLSGTLVRQIIIGSVPGNTNVSPSPTWDGKDDSSVFVADGTYVVVAANGTTETTASATPVVVDNTNPTVALVSPADNAFVMGNVTLEASASDAGGSGIEKVEFYVDGSLHSTDTNPGNGITDSFNTASGPTALSDGDHTWYAKAFDFAGNNATTATRTIKVDNTRPSVTINQAAGQADPTSASPINFTAVFSEPVTGFATGDVSFTGSTAGGTLVGTVSEVVPLDGTTYNVAVSGMTTGGTVVATITANRADDAAGNGNTASTSGDNSVTFVTDSEAPVVTVSFPTPDGSNGWFKTSPVVGSVAADDSTTGNSNITAISCPGFTVGAITGLGTPSASASLTVSAEGMNNVSCTATDSASNTGASAGSTAMPVVVKIDTVAPTGVAGAAARAFDHNDWYNAPVDIDFSGNDVTSGVDTCTSTNYSGPDSATASVLGSCTDNAGNQSAEESFDFKYDGTGPTATLSVTAGTPGANDWYTSDVTVDTDGSDAVSGIESCTADQFQTTETAGTLFNGSCTNNAGLTTNATALNVKLDKTAPTAELSVTAGTLGLNGWYTDDVTVHAAGTDSISEPVVCSDDQFQTTDTAGQEFNGSCTNDAGLSTNADPLTIKRDATAPTLTLVFTPDAPDGGGGWWKTVGGVPFLWTCSDATAGIDTTYNSGCPSPLSGTETANGTTNFTDQVRDLAGNLSVLVNRDLKLDNVAPSVVWDFANDSCTVPGSAGWCRGTQTASFTASDATSGLAGVSPFTQSTGTNGGAVNIPSGSVFDLAGNENSGVNAGPYKIDSVAPTISLVTPAEGANYTLNAAVAASYTCDDVTSGVGNCTGNVPNGSNFSTSPVGAKTFTVNATDVAGNPATPVTHNYSVLYSTGACLGNLGHTILQPIDWTGTSVFKQKSTVPAKFRVCDANGASIGTPGVVSAFNIIQIIGGTVMDVNEPVDSTTPDTVFRWSPTDQQWIFNTNTKGLSAGKTYVFKVLLNDGSSIIYQFGLK